MVPAASSSAHHAANVGANRSSADRSPAAIGKPGVPVAVLALLLASLLFPDDMSDYDGYEDYFLSRRRWFFGLFATTFVVVAGSRLGSTLRSRPQATSATAAARRALRASAR